MRLRAVFLRWWTLGLVLTLVNTTGNLFVVITGTPYNWTLRGAQFLAGIYFLMAAITLLKDARANRVHVSEVMADRFADVKARLKESEEQYRELVESSNSIIMRVDKDLNITYMNEFGLEFFGYTAEEIIGKNVIGTTIPQKDGRGRDLEAMAAEIIRQPAQYKTNVHQNMRKNGELVWVSWTNHTNYNPDGTVAGVLAIGNDISGLMKTEEALQQSEAKYRSLFNGMSEGFGLHEIILDAKGIPCDYRFLELNDAFEKMTGLSRDKVIGKTVREVLPEIESFWVETYGKVALSGEPVHFENYSAPLDKWYGVYAYSPAKHQFATLFEDITERKKAEKEKEKLLADLERQMATQRSAFSSVLVGILLYDKEGGLTSLNPVAKKMLGYDEETLNLPLPERLKKLRVTGLDGRPIPAEETLPALALRGEVVRDYTFMIHPPQGEARYIAGDATRIKSNRRQHNRRHRYPGGHHRAQKS